MRMRMSAIFVTVVALSFVASVIAAPTTQIRANGGVRAQGGPIQAFARVLNLTPQQVDQVKAILTSYRSDLKALRASTKTKDEKIAAAKQLREQAKTAIYALLDPTQKAKADQSRAIERLLTPGMFDHLTKCLASLNLTQVQKTQIKGFKKDANANARAVRQNRSLTKDAKMAQIKQIRQALIDQISSVLTPEQRDKFIQCSQARARGAGQGPRAGAAGRK
jgi:Spy/CpxP family protein refolding chaperone